MIAYLNHGRWVAHCPNPLCYSAMALEPGCPGTVCVCRDLDTCEHGPVCLSVIRAEWPDDLEAIIRATAGRPRPNQNWMPGETVAMLLAENALHGVSW